ncbi:sulfatase-like hydrolase/transferase, partial [bacterium]|nr:sulfatase-like hydrolase/transferase [bacterium]
MRMKRRDFMRSTVAGSVGMGLTSAISAAPQKRPNVLVILADDMGFSDLGCYGGEINTPNLDKLAKGGVRFSQFYNAARCCPTRASLLTGLYPQQAGVGGMVHDEGVPSYQGFLDERSVTMAEMLKGSGYKTYMAGKWHVGNDKGHWPLDRGFDRYFGLINGASNFFNNIYFRNPNKKQTILLDNEPFEIEPTTEDMW